MKPVRLFTNVWGAMHLEWWRDFAMPSLFWGSNGEALIGAKWTVCTTRVSHAQVEAILKEQTIIPRENISIEIDERPDLLRFLRHTIDVCLNEGSRMLMAPPDTIFGPDSIRSLKQLSEHGECVAVPHMRVLPGPDYLDIYPTNANLVSKALHNAHLSWTESELGKKPSASFFGGITWRWVAAGLISVQHRLPTVYMANFNDFDRKFFDRASHFLFWDTYWPHDLVYQERFRVVGSSDVAFMCELTEENKNVPKLTDISPSPDAYHMIGYDHNLVCRQFLATFREG